MHAFPFSNIGLEIRQTPFCSIVRVLAELSLSCAALTVCPSAPVAVSGISKLACNFVEVGQRTVAAHKLSAA